VYVQWVQTRPPFAGQVAIDKVTTGGVGQWSYKVASDNPLGEWEALVQGNLAVDDDGLDYVDPMTGALIRWAEWDSWGQLVPDATRTYYENGWHFDNFGVYVGAVDATGSESWRQNQYGNCKLDVVETMGGLAESEDGKSLYYAPLYTPGSAGLTVSFSSGVYAFDTAMGTPGWMQTSQPQSAISVGQKRIYLVEASASGGGTTLVARSEADGTVVWSQSVTNAGAQAPVLAGGKVIVGTAAGVLAFDPVSGDPAWSASSVSAVAAPTTELFYGGCGGNIHPGGAIVTKLAAATGTETLVVAGDDGRLHLLSLSDGRESWTGAAPVLPVDGGAADASAVDASVADGGVPVAQGPLTDPVIVGKTIYVSDGSGILAYGSQ
jgi:hypothetical protein